MGRGEEGHSSPREKEAEVTALKSSLLDNGLVFLHPEVTATVAIGHFMREYSTRVPAHLRMCTRIVLRWVKCGVSELRALLAFHQFFQAPIRCLNPLIVQIWALQYQSHHTCDKRCLH